MAGAGKGGKKFHRGAWPIRDEAALEMKLRLDRKIIGAIRESLVAMSPRQDDVGAAEVYMETVPRRCDECGLFQRLDWLRCPFHA